MPGSSCKSCGAEIRWGLTEKGRRIPLDPNPVEGGNVQVKETAPNGTLLIRVVPVDPSVMRYVSHFATCPNVKSHRKRGG